MNQNPLTSPSVMGYGYRPFINVAAFSGGRADKSRDYKLLHDRDLHKLSKRHMLPNAYTSFAWSSTEQ